MSYRTAFQTNLSSPYHRFPPHPFRRLCRRTSPSIVRPFPSRLRYASCQSLQDSHSPSQNASSLEEQSNCNKTLWKKPYGYWKKTSNILQELRDYLASKDCPDKSVMPTRTQLIQAGRHDLAGAISRAGWSVVAEAANLPLSSIVRPRSLNLVFATRLHLTTGRMRPYMYWRDFNHVHGELLQTMRELNINYLPSAQRLIHIGRSDLARAIQIHGGWRAVAARMDVKCASDKSSTKREQTLSISLREFVAEELKRVTRSAGRSCHDGPTASEPHCIIDGSILHDIQVRFGGLKRVERFVNSPNASPYSSEDNLQEVKDVIRSHVLECVRLACKRKPERDSGMMPGKSELTALGRSDLAGLVDKLGRNQVARFCGLRTRRFSKRRKVL